MCSWLPKLNTFCFHYKLRTGVFVVAAGRSLIWVTFIILVVIGTPGLVFDDPPIGTYEETTTAAPADDVFGQAANNVVEEVSSGLYVTTAVIFLTILGVGLLSEALLFLGTLFYIAWPLIVWLCVSSLILFFFVGLLFNDITSGEYGFGFWLELFIVVSQIYCTWIVCSELHHVRHRPGVVLREGVEANATCTPAPAATSTTPMVPMGAARQPISDPNVPPIGPPPSFEEAVRQPAYNPEFAA